jgi:hypothetical protein
MRRRSRRNPKGQRRHRGASVGTGVLRLAEYDIGKLAARAYTLNAASGGRFILGVGNGQGSGSSAVERLVVLSNELRASYPGGAQPPTVFFSALRPR